MRILNWSTAGVLIAYLVIVGLVVKPKPAVKLPETKKADSLFVPRALLIEELHYYSSEVYDTTRREIRLLLVGLVAGLASTLVLKRKDLPTIPLRWLILIGYGAIVWIYAIDRYELYVSDRGPERRIEILSALTQHGDSVKTNRPAFADLTVSDFCGKICSLFSPRIDHVLWYVPLILYIAVVFEFYNRRDNKRKSSRMFLHR